MHVKLGVARMQRDVARGHIQHVLDQRAGKTDAPVIAQDRARPGQDLDTRWRRIGQADHLERFQRALVNFLHTCVADRAVLTASHARAHGAHILGQGGRTQRHPRRPPT